MSNGFYSEDIGGEASCSIFRVTNNSLRVTKKIVIRRWRFAGGDSQTQKKCKNFVSEIHLFILKRGRVFHIEILEDRFIFFINTCFS